MPLFHSSSHSSSDRSSIDDPNTTSSHSHRRSHRSSGSGSYHSSSSTSPSSSRHHSHSLFGHSRKNEDPSILAAKEQVSRAEAAEREADRALMASKRAGARSKDEAGPGEVDYEEGEAVGKYVTLSSYICVKDGADKRFLGHV
ncbi:hypothetical protein ASPNIDRAFT_38075 [Aspergillus niger ATCC 1015]|uniref:Uncharacterized protein n=1 Tax=Aspergillus niger (strain ATCC 1015 / CBS 113.46 / FGSC A1144 / LSHB Ac4 / NCTC 3858a / NRRL 328 / USDA 3528.7) TaxID=380704 RepID=G3YEY3_ASPNA|nr:hypothetical protein ASPNIDRAFT_38075 [Aspergillus niger ATCC 1015]